MGFSEAAQKIVAGTHHNHLVDTGDVDRADPGLSYSTVYLYPVLD